MRRLGDFGADNRPCPKCRRRPTDGAMFRPRSEVRADGTRARRQICIECNAIRRKQLEMKRSLEWKGLGYDAYGRPRRLRSAIATIERRRASG